MRSDKKPPLKSDKKAPPKVQKKGSIGYNKKSALLEDAITQMNAGKYGRASSALKDLLALDPLNAEARRLFATLHLRLGSLMSARTAFESLAREAMERQDYWLAESLLREYLTAGPRYVPFLEMLGRVYEEKGDVMAAVAEYGKAVEVLLEDPDTEKPNHPSDLFARIRSIAPGSPVAFRFAAMFDTVTGQVLQASPQPAAPALESEAPQAAAGPDAVVDNTVTMPWEQVESPAAASIAPEAPVSAVEPAVEVSEPVVAPALPIEPVAADGRQDTSLGQSSAPDGSISYTGPEPQALAEATPSSMAPVEEPARTVTHSETSVTDLLPTSTGEAESPTPSVAVESQPAIGMLAEADGGHPIAQAPSSPAPMPWDQVEEVAVVIPPASVIQESPVPEPAVSVPVEPEPAAALSVEAVPPTIEVRGETGSQSMAQAPSSQAPLPGDQVEEQAIAISSTPASQESSVHESATEASSEPGLQAASISDPAPRTIEVLSQSGSHPIVEPPVSPVSMPWDQVQESPVLIPPPADQSASTVEVVAQESSGAEEPSSSTVEAVTPTIEVLTQVTSHPIAQPPTSPAPMPWDQVQETMTETPQSIEATAERDAVGVAPAPPSGSSGSEVTSSGLSWDEILAAVAAMQSSPAPTQTLPGAEPEPISDHTTTDKLAQEVTPTPGPVEAESTLYEAPVVEPSVDPGSTAAALSAPMPWEQIEVDDLTIPRQEPEPEFGPVSAEAPGGPLDPTLVLPAEPNMAEPTVSTDGPVVSAADLSATVVADSGPEFRLLAPEVPSELGTTPVPPAVAAHEEADAQVSGYLLEPSGILAEEEPAAASLRLAGSESTPLVVAVEPVHVEVAPVTEFTIAGMQNESPTVLSPEPILETEQSVEVIPAQAAMTTPEPETVVEEIVTLASPMPIEEQAVVEVDPIVPLMQVDATVDRPTAPTPECSTVVDQEPVSPSAAQDVVGAPIVETTVPPVEVPSAPAEMVQELQPVSSAVEVTDVPAEDLLQQVAAPTQDSEPVQPELLLETAAESVVSVNAPAAEPSTPAPSEPTAGDGLRILWEDASSAPTPKPSSGNMLTRWLKKPTEPVQPEVSAVDSSTAVPGEPLASIVPLPVEESVPAEVVTEPPLEQMEQAPPVLAEEPALRPKPSQPTGGGVWSRVAEVAASLVGAGVSTTRSLVVLVLGLVGLALLLVGGTVGVVALTWMVLDEQPSAAYRTMTSVPQQTLQDSSKNGYLLLLGFGAAASQDPVQAGMERRVESADLAFTHTCLTGEGYAPGGEQSASADAAGKWMKTADPAAQMLQGASGVKTWVSQAEVSLGRYRQWLNKPFEDVGYGQPISPNCGLILHTHRLYVADGFTQDVETGMARLETDLTAWRTVLGQAKTLSVKMLASAAMNDDIAIMGGLLQRPDLDDRFVGRLAKLARPLEQTEQSLRWPMQSQFVLATKTIDDAISQDRAEARPVYGAIAAALPLPKQRRFNAYAQYYEVAGKAAAEGRYADLPKQSQFVHAPPYGVSDMLMNPIESLVGVDPLPTWDTYAGRVLETDARLRLASLQAWLRRTPPEQDLLTRLAKAGQGLYDPFTGLPMLVNMKKSVLYSVGPDLKDNEAHERLDLVAQIPSVAWVGGKKPADASKSK